LEGCESGEMFSVQTEAIRLLGIIGDGGLLLGPVSSLGFELVDLVTGLWGFRVRELPSVVSAAT
jgi:hypothetical protein